MNTKKSKFSWVWTALIVVVSIFILFSFINVGDNGKRISVVGEFEQLVLDDKVSDVYISAGKGYILLTEEFSKVKADSFPTSSDCYFTYATNATVEEVYAIINNYNQSLTVAEKDKVINIVDVPESASFFETIMPVLYIISAVVIIFFIVKMFAKSSGSAMSFSKNKARVTTNSKVRFTDIAGADEEKEELAEIVEFLKNPQKFTAIGARIPKGVLLVGNPGTGKTLLARAVAGESNVPFLSISGSDFVEMFVGVGASRVRDLFEAAKKSQPCIIFIDEIDAVGRQRGTGMGGGNDEREQTLNQLLVEMDGFEANEGIIVLAATNRSDVLDPALLRPGRFDRQVYVHAPDVKGREGIIKIHARNKKIADNIDFTTLARITSGFTGADIENMLNEAAIIAARAGRTKIIMQDIQEGINKVIMGPQKKSLVVTDNDKLITAYHESGHAIIGKLLENCEGVQEVSIIPRGNAAGYTMSRPESDDNHMGKNKLNDTIAMMMGGRVSEELFMKDISTGASNDIKRATQIARKMVTVWGMSNKFGFMGFDSEEEIFIGRQNQYKSDYSEQTAFDIDKEVKDILDNNYSKAIKILKENSKIVKEMSELLLEKNTIYAEEIDMLFAGKSKEEIIEYMDACEQKRIKEQEEYKKVADKENKLRMLENKLKTAKMYLKEGIISKADYDLIEKEKNDFEKSQEAEEQTDLQNNKDVNVLKEDKAATEENTEIKDDKKNDLAEDNKDTNKEVEEKEIKKENKNNEEN